MNPFVIAGAVLLITVIAAYVVATRREIARLPPLDKPAGKARPGDSKQGSIANSDSQ
jgi:hypothetical protein